MSAINPAEVPQLEWQARLQQAQARPFVQHFTQAYPAGTNFRHVVSTEDWSHVTGQANEPLAAATAMNCLEFLVAGLVRAIPQQLQRSVITNIMTTGLPENKYYGAEGATHDPNCKWIKCQGAYKCQIQIANMQGTIKWGDITPKPSQLDLRIGDFIGIVAAAILADGQPKNLGSTHWVGVKVPHPDVLSSLVVSHDARPTGEASVQHETLAQSVRFWLNMNYHPSWTSTSNAYKHRQHEIGNPEWQTRPHGEVIFLVYRANAAFFPSPA